MQDLGLSFGISLAFQGFKEFVKNTEALKRFSANLDQSTKSVKALNKGSYEGSFSMIGKNIKAGASLEIKGIDEKAIFSIKDVKHDFSLSGYTISVNFEG